MPLSAERARFLRYAGVGVFTTLLDLTLFSVFAVVLGVPALAANVLSTCITVCFSYLANRLVVFRSDAGATKTFLPFVTVTLFSGLIVQSIVIWCVLHGGHAVQPSVSHDLLAPAGKVVAMAVGMAANYLGYRWLFGRHAGPGGVRCHRLPRRLRALCSDTWRCR